MTIMHYLPFPSTFGILFITFIAITFVLKVSNRSLVRNKIRTRELQTPTFANTFPDRHLVANLMQLSEDIYDVDDGVPPQDAISNPYYEFKFWIEALLSTEAMIVLDNEKSPSLTTTTGRPIIVFRGSEERDDWEVNFNIPTEKSEFINAPDSVKIHRGFQSALFDQNIISQLETELLQLIGKDGDVIVTGHSLGAANAHIMATYLADKYREMKVTMINFGAPRIGNEAFKIWTETELSNLSAWRYVNRKDFIPRAIPGFDHAGHLFAIYDKKARVYYNQIGNEQGYKGVRRSWYFASSINQHKSRAYEKHFLNEINNDRFWPTDFVKKRKCIWWDFLC